VPIPLHKKHNVTPSHSARAHRQEYIYKEVSMMKSGDVITFDAKKNFTYIKPLGDGGTGYTHLFKDETTDMEFAIKKYVPKDARFIDDHYKRFVDEIKILLNISHPNIVRIYNYYLYPTAKTGFLQMEYIDGINIDEFTPSPWEDKYWNEIFSETISAFEYLEQNHILHRDIRPANILIDKNSNVKIIDFGFGKQLDGAKKEENSILLNWPATELPDEVLLSHEYDERTEIYFVGTLFRHLLKDDPDIFRFPHILEKMTKINPIQRYNSFTEIVNDISAGVLGEIEFTENEKEDYRCFACYLTDHINHYVKKYSPINDISVILLKMAELIRNSSLEEYIQDNSKLIGCFINGGYNYNGKKDIKVETVIDFYGLVTSIPPAKQKILFDNIFNRLSTIKVYIEDDELPF
jgi:serine/threonine-protein kinase